MSRERLQDHWSFYYSGLISLTLVAMAILILYSLISGRIKVDSFYCLIWNNYILFLLKRSLNSSPHFIRL